MGQGQGCVNVCPLRALRRAPHPSPTRPTVHYALVFPQVVHKALLDVAEEGTEAAAATGSKIILLSGKMGPLMTVHFNRPFLVCILHRDTKNILFWGKVTNPNQA